MFERFTDRARRVVVLAQEEARLLNHNYIGTEHLLLGLLHEGEGVGYHVLTSLSLTLHGVRDEIEGIVGQGGSLPSGHIPFTPRAKKVLELSLREAIGLGHNYIGTEHVLLGLVREGEGVAAQVLVLRGGIELDQVRRSVVDMLAGTPTPRAPFSPPDAAPDFDALAAEAADFAAVLGVVAQAFAAGTSDTDRAAALESGDALVAQWAQARQRGAPWTEAGEVRPWRVRFPTPAEAEVSFLLAGGETPLPLRASVERVDGRWRVRRASFCQLLAAAGAPCD